MFENFTVKYKFQQLVTIFFTGHFFPNSVLIIITTDLILVTCFFSIS